MKIKYLSIFLTLISAASMANPQWPTGFKEKALELSGPKSESCGEVDTKESRDSINACAKSNVAKKISFYALYTMKGIDSYVAKGIAFDGGQLYIIGYDSYSSSGKPAPRVYVHKCKSIEYQELTAEQSVSFLPIICGRD